MRDPMGDTPPPRWNQWIGGGLMLVVIVVGFIVKFSNPDMTQTRLTITYWWLWLVLLGVMAFGMWLAQKDDG